MNRGSERYTPIAWLDTGSSSQIYLAIDNVSGRQCVLKEVSKTGSDAKWQERIRREIDVMSSITFPFIVKYYNSFEDGAAFYIAMEYCEGGDLASKVVNQHALSEELAVSYLTQLAFALDYLHNEKNVIHRDVKVENILFDRHGQLKLADFGFSTFTDAHAVQKRTMCGSPAYASPELILHDAYSAACDVWSAGVVFYVMLSGKLPFQGATIQECMRSVLEDKLDVPDNVSDEAADLLARMLTRDAAQRINIRDVLSHPCITRAGSFLALQRVANGGVFLGDGVDDARPIRMYKSGYNLKELIQKSRSIERGQTSVHITGNLQLKTSEEKPEEPRLLKAGAARATHPMFRFRRGQGRAMSRVYTKPIPTFMK